MIRLHTNVRHVIPLVPKRNASSRYGLNGVRITEVPSHLPVVGPGMTGMTSYCVEACDGRMYLRVVGDAGSASSLPRRAIVRVLDDLNPEEKSEPPVAYTVPRDLLTNIKASSQYVEIDIPEETGPTVDLFVDGRKISDRRVDDDKDGRWPNTNEGGGGIFPSGQLRVSLKFNPERMATLLSVMAKMGCDKVTLSIPEYPDGKPVRIDGEVAVSGDYHTQHLTALLIVEALPGDAK